MAAILGFLSVHKTEPGAFPSFFAQVSFLIRSRYAHVYAHRQKEAASTIERASGERGRSGCEDPCPSLSKDVGPLKLKST